MLTDALSLFQFAFEKPVLDLQGTLNEIKLLIRFLRRKDEYNRHVCTYRVKLEDIGGVLLLKPLAHFHHV